MESEIQLSEPEKRYFAELFIYYDTEKNGKIQNYKASELFNSAHLSSDIIKQINELCGATRSNYLDKQRFFLALKLIAASQAGFTLRPDLFTSPLETPLPNFSWTKNTEISDSSDSLPGDLIQLQTSSPIQVTNNNQSNVEIKVEKTTNSLNTNGEESLTQHSIKAPSPEASSTASDSPTPTNSVHERNWIENPNWHGLVSEEQCQLLGTEEESSDRHSSDEDFDDSQIWTITEEQRVYYTAQFRSLPTDSQGNIAGPVARLFFEKSRLPVQELRKIWQLADITKDGALSLEEFSTAMHLVVLRRNNINLPDNLPASLIPQHQPVLNGADAVSKLATDTVSEEYVPNISPSSGDPSSPQRSKEWTKFVDSPTNSVSSPGPKPVNFDFHKSAVEQNPKILHPVPLRVTPESQNLTTYEDETSKSPRKGSESQSLSYDQFSSNADISPKKLSSNIINDTSSSSSDLRPIQRPQPKKPAAPGPGAIPPPPQLSTYLSVEEVAASSGAVTAPLSLPSTISSGPIGSKKDPPPPPPPRPYRTHTRSSSLDLNRLGKSTLLGTPPIPPRVSPSMISPKKISIPKNDREDVPDGKRFANFSSFGQDDDLDDNMQPRKHGAFEVYRKPTSKSGLVEMTSSFDMETTPIEPPAKQRHCSEPNALGSATRRNIEEFPIKKLQEQNSLLIRICQELNQELAEIQEERTSLELQLEHFKSHI